MKHIIGISIFSLLLTLPVGARAQDQLAAPAPQDQLQPQPPAPQDQPQPPAPQTFGTLPAVAISHVVPARKSPVTALTGTLVGTGLGMGLLVGGLARDQGALITIGLTTLVVAPSFGYFYTGETGRAVAHMGVRAGAVGILFVGVLTAVYEGLGCGWDGACERSNAALTLAAGGLVIGAGSIAYSIYDAPRSARRHNARHRQLMLVPTPMTGPDHSSGLGLQLGGRF